MLSLESQHYGFSKLLFCYITNHLLTGPLGNSKFCCSRISAVSLDFVLGNIEILRKQNLLFPSEPVIKC